MEGKFEKSGGILADRMSPKFRHLTAKFKPKNVGGITSSLRPNLLVLKAKRKEKSTGSPISSKWAFLEQERAGQEPGQRRSKREGQGRDG
jgi:hypothetical protein